MSIHLPERLRIFVERFGIWGSVAGLVGAIAIGIAIFFPPDGDLLISSSPTAADIFINDKPYGKAPLSVQLKGGLYTVTGTLDGFQQVGQIVKVEKDRTVSVNLSLLPKSSADIESFRQMLRRVEQLESQINVIRQTPPLSESKLSNGVKSLSKEVDALKTSLKGMQDAIQENPEKSLSLPLMRKDIESIKSESVALKSEIERMVELGKWLIGTFALGLLGIIISQIVSRK